MYTFKDLYDSTMKFMKRMNGTDRTSIDVDAKLVDIVPNTYSKIITFKYRVKSVKKRNDGYNCYLQFYNVEFSDHPISSSSVKIIEKDTGKPLYFERISITEKKRQNYVRVRCTCFDFRHRFAWEDKAVNALYGGAPAKYTPKPGSNRPPVNPDHIPGMCKHLIACARGSQHYFMR